MKKPRKSKKHFGTRKGARKLKLSPDEGRKLADAMRFRGEDRANLAPEAKSDAAT